MVFDDVTKLRLERARANGLHRHYPYMLVMRKAFHRGALAGMEVQDTFPLTTSEDVRDYLARIKLAEEGGRLDYKVVEHELVEI